MPSRILGQTPNVRAQGKRNFGGDRFIPKRHTMSIDGDPKAFCAMESSHSFSIDREQSAMNLSITSNERWERREEHKNNLFATMINPDAAKAKRFIALANNSL